MSKTFLNKFNKNLINNFSMFNVKASLINFLVEILIKKEKVVSRADKKMFHIYQTLKLIEKKFGKIYL